MSVYNDDGDSQHVRLQLSTSQELTQSCKDGCDGHGDCVQGQCQCHAGYAGEYCTISELNH